MTPDAGDNVLEISGLTRRFGKFTAVDNLSFSVRRGEIFGFLGPNGAGKTTSIRMICGLLRPDDGRIAFIGIGGGTFRGFGIAPQEIVIWPTLTCLEQLTFMGEMYDLPAARARERARSLLADFGLEGQADRRGNALSGGMQRRLNIALALVHQPELIILDEPQAGLDPQSRVLVRNVLQSLRGQTTVVITTHDMEEAEKLADRIGIIDHGRLLVLDSVDALTRNRQITIEEVFIGLTGKDLRS